MFHLSQNTAGTAYLSTKESNLASSSDSPTKTSSVPTCFWTQNTKKWNISTLWLLSHQSWDLRRFEVGSAGLCFNSDIGGSIRLQWHPGGPGAYDGASLSRATHALLAVPGEHYWPVWLQGQQGYFTFSTERNRTRRAGLLCGRKLHQTNASTCRQRICVQTASHTHNQLILDSGYIRWVILILAYFYM